MQRKKPIIPFVIVICVFLVLPSLHLVAGGKKEKDKEKQEPSLEITTGEEGQDGSSDSEESSLESTAEQRGGDSSPEQNGDEGEGSGTPMARQQQTAFIINGRQIPEQRVTIELFFTVQQLQAQGRQVQDSDLEALREKLVPQAINQELFYQAATDNGVVVNSSLVDRQMDTLAKQFGGEETLKKLLAQWDLPLSACREAVERQMAISMFFGQEFKEDIHVSEQEVKDYYNDNPDLFDKPEQVRASQIVVGLDRNAGEEETKAAREKINSLEKRVQEGADFAEMAREHSEGASAQYGGDLGFFERDRMPDAIDAAAFSLDVGEVSDVLRTDSGFHIIKVTDHREATTMTYQDARQSLMNHLQMKKLRELAEAYLEELRADAEIKIVR